MEPGEKTGIDRRGLGLAVFACAESPKPLTLRHFALRQAQDERGFGSCLSVRGEGLSPRIS
jgi:hypothetical protein